MNHLIHSSGPVAGTLIIGAIVFLESGIPVGFFLPGDTLLFTAGFFAAQHYLVLGWLIFMVIVAKLFGSNAGYLLGVKAGRPLFNKPDSFFFRKDFLNSAEAFYQKHGGKTVTIGQFIPVIRTFTPIVAGIAKMRVKLFLIYNFVGAVAWGIIIILLGYFVGSKVPNIDKYLLPIVLLATVFSFAPAGWHFFGKKENRDKLLSKLKRSSTSK